MLPREGGRDAEESREVGSFFLQPLFVRLDVLGQAV